jgi:hypothetical protein
VFLQPRAYINYLIRSPFPLHRNGTLGSATSAQPESIL